MKRILPILMVTIMCAGAAAAQSSASAQAGTSANSQNSAQMGKSGAQASGNESGSTSSSASATAGTMEMTSGTKIDATLTHSLDARKNKTGDRVEAVVTRDVKQDGHVVLKKGTRLMGHVTEVQARTKDNAQSQLGIMFDHAMTSKGQMMPLNATIQALAATHSATETSSGMAQDGAAGSMGGAANGGGSLVSGVASTAGAATSGVNTSTLTTGNAEGALASTTRSEGAIGGLTNTGRLASNSSGVFGLQGLSLRSDASSATNGSTIVCPNKNVHLDNGTQMLLSVSGNSQQH